AAVAPAGAKMPRNGIGAVPERLQQPPCDHRCGHDGDHRHCRDHEAHLVLVAIEGDDDFARPVRKPRKAKGKGEDDEKEEQDTDHGRLPALSQLFIALEISASIWASASSLAFSLPAKSAPAAFAGSGSVSYSPSARP